MHRMYLPFSSLGRKKPISFPEHLAVHSQGKRKKFKVYLLLTLTGVKCQLKKLNPGNLIISLFTIQAPVLTLITAAKLQM